jgi:uncharacterized OB-fold protein
MHDLRAVLPKPTAASAPFWEACDREELMLPVCEACAHVFYYPRIHCPACGSRRVGWQRGCGRGTVFSFTHVAVSFHGPDWESQLPYTVVLVDLEEGVRMVSRLIGDTRADVRTGDAVTVTFPLIEGRRLPYFERALPPENQPP